MITLKGTRVTWSKKITTYSFIVIATYIRPYCEHFFKTVPVPEKLEINLTNWDNVLRLNLWLFTISVKSKVPLQHHLEITWPLADNSLDSIMAGETGSRIYSRETDCLFSNNVAKIWAENLKEHWNEEILNFKIYFYTFHTSCLSAFNTEFLSKINMFKNKHSKKYSFCLI